MRIRSEPTAARNGAALRILETAKGLFYRRGIRAVGIDEIVRRAGVTKPSLYRSFASKDDLVAACLEQYADETRAQLDARIAAAGEDPLTRLCAFIRYCADRIAEPDFRGSAMSNTAVEFPEAGHPGRAVVQSWKREMRDRVLGMARHLAVGDPRELADGLILLIDGAVDTRHVFGPEGPARALIRSADRLIDAHLRSGQDRLCRCTPDTGDRVRTPGFQRRAKGRNAAPQAPSTPDVCSPKGPTVVCGHGR